MYINKTHTHIYIYICDIYTITLLHNKSTNQYINNNIYQSNNQSTYLSTYPTIYPPEILANLVIDSVDRASLRPKWGSDPKSISGGLCGPWRSPPCAGHFGWRLSAWWVSSWSSSWHWARLERDGQYWSILNMYSPNEFSENGRNFKKIMKHQA